ncbi:MAG: exodeoxyribonuclease VII small subunit [Anaerolineales bacterium]|nr:exodeoxyribonuclease VII small subunit [Anaerolineales bacterium]
MTVPQDQSPPIINLSYEQAFAELENIVAILESEKRSLDETISLFSRGQLMAQYCAALLDQAELKIQSISGDELADFTPASE